jgi:hypothetical protein
MTVNRYEPSSPRVAFGIAAVAMTAITIAFVIPAEAGIHWLLTVAKWVPAEACPRMLESGAGTTLIAAIAAAILSLSRGPVR